MPTKETRTTQTRRDAAREVVFENTAPGLSRQLVALFIFAAIVIVAVIIYFFSPWFRGAGDEMVKKQVEDVKITSSNPQVGDILQKVSHHILLPSGEVTVSTVTDADKLRQSNPFFYQSAVAGDKILVYPDRAILYNPTKDIVLNLIYIVNTPTSTPSTTPKK